MFFDKLYIKLIMMLENYLERRWLKDNGQFFSLKNAWIQIYSQNFMTKTGGGQINGNTKHFTIIIFERSLKDQNVVYVPI